jgi:hypothetical protein
MIRTGYPPTDHAMLVRGFAVILHEAEYLDLITRHTALIQGDYGTYLADLHRRMSAAHRSGKRVLIGPFLTDQYESYAEAIGESPCSDQALRAYDDFVARIGAHTRVWNGEPIGHVVADLREATDTSADQAALLPLLRQAASRHTDPQRAAGEALTTATGIFAPLLKRTKPGHHTLTCAIQFPRELISYVLPVVRAKDLVAFPDGGPEQLLCVALATAQLANYPAVLILRSRNLTTHAEPTQESHDTNDHPDPLVIRAWRLAAGRAIPLSAAQAFDLVRTDPVSGQPRPPEPDARYEDAFALTDQPPQPDAHAAIPDASRPS